jgi:hypothetical protein
MNPEPLGGQLVISQDIENKTPYFGIFNSVKELVMVKILSPYFRGIANDKFSL